MRIIGVAAVSVALCAPVLACNSEMLAATDWVLGEAGGALGPMMTVVAVKVQNNADQVITMANIEVTLYDLLGQELLTFKGDPDVKREPGVEVVEFGYSPNPSAKRLKDLEHSQVTISSCTLGVAFEDGTVARFD